ncbi:hypothetical protein G6F43_002944 [Rhizopus delemar]|nr:hypothetical protein G6F43_002944 [Rhizopus delemar]
MPINKSNYQPKDARAVSNPYQDDGDDDDIDDLFPTRKMMTGTQALVDFLKTTSPEEFQRPERLTTSTNIFSRIRKTKRVPSTRSVPPSATNKKGHVELVTKSAGNSRTPSFDTTSIQTLVTRNNNPILPNKKRESSLYSGSLRHSVSIKSQSSHVGGRRFVSSYPESHKLPKVTIDAFLDASNGNDMVETALLQRLERVRMLGQPIPSDYVTDCLSTEHIRALGITHILEQSKQEQKKVSTEKKVRHMQVQTMDWTENDQKRNSTQINHEEEMENKEESRSKRAELALEEALDNFEVISGLAYAKLRELWEEKMRWENACMELRDRLLALEQGKRYDDNYFLDEEDEDDLGLSEFPLQ